MGKYIVRISREYGSAYITETVEAEDEKSAFLKVRDIAVSKGIVLPNEVWTNIREVKTNPCSPSGTPNKTL